MEKCLEGNKPITSTDKEVTKGNCTFILSKFIIWCHYKYVFMYYMCN